MSPAEIHSHWRAAWPQALAAWSRYTRLRSPLLCSARVAAAREGLSGSFAMIRLVDQTVVIDLETIAAHGIADYAVEILAHEIGHHVYVPASVTDHARALARMRRALPTLENQAPLVANLYSDLLINDRLQRSAGLRMAAVMQQVVAASRGAPMSPLWRFYLRSYELLWAMPSGSLVAVGEDAQLEGDARLAARLIRAYSGARWLEGVARYGALVLPWLVASKQQEEAAAALWHDTREAGAGGDPDGLTELDPGELGEIVHPAFDEELSGVARESADAADAAPAQSGSVAAGGQGQARTPYEYGEILRLSGLKLSAQDIAIRYYEERARPYLVPFPVRETPETEEPLPEGVEAWEMGEPLDRIDWRESLLRSPQPIPGLTTVQRVYGSVQGVARSRQPLDLDLYVDSSGSMPDPRMVLSWPALAGAVICLSALRAGAAVSVHLWSDKRQVMSTPGFVRDAREALRVLVGYYGGGTQFPLPLMRDLHASRKRLLRPTHILVVSDDGASTMFDTPDERGTPGWDVCREALAAAGGGGTLALNIRDDWERFEQPAYQWFLRARREQGWLVSAVASLADLLNFAREFSRHHYQRGATSRGEP